jgi:AraC-like DNA-binding protein
MTPQRRLPKPPLLLHNLTNLWQPMRLLAGPLLDFQHQCLTVKMTMEHRHGRELSVTDTRTETLAAAIARIAQNAGDFTTAIPWLSLHRRNAVTEPLPCIYEFGLGVIAQGEKQVMLGEEVFYYGAGKTMLATIDLPVVSNVTVATPSAPFLGLMVAIDPRVIAQSAAEMEVERQQKGSTYRALSVGGLEPMVLDALIRLVRLLDEPELLPHVAPLIQREIVVRLLAGPYGPRLRHLVSAGSPSQQIAKAVAWLKQNFSRAMNPDDLAANAHMSPSTFRHHFRAVTGMSPLQYQKQLRLQEARQLMLTQNFDAGSAGVRVGYESASQFSREYARLFGAPPLRDIQRLRLMA